MQQVRLLNTMFDFADLGGKVHIRKIGKALDNPYLLVTHLTLCYRDIKPGDTLLQERVVLLDALCKKCWHDIEHYPQYISKEEVPDVIE